VSVSAWAAFFAPAKLPPVITERLSRELNAILARAEVREQVGKHGFVMRGSSPEALAEFLQKELDAWARAAQVAKLPRE
jgi:tripartite-type tricarboxylate transporter receptor subunit TctC